MIKRFYLFDNDNDYYEFKAILVIDAEDNVFDLIKRVDWEMDKIVEVFDIAALKDGFIVDEDTNAKYSLDGSTYNVRDLPMLEAVIEDDRYRVSDLWFVENKLDPHIEHLVETLVEWGEDAEYWIDGIQVTYEEFQERTRPPTN